MRSTLSLLLLLCITRAVSGQMVTNFDRSFKIVLPQTPQWNIGHEGDLFDFRFGVSPQPDSTVRFSMNAPDNLGMRMSPRGHFTWQTNPNIITSEQEEEYYYILIRAEAGDKKDSTFIELVLINKDIEGAINTTHQVNPQPALEAEGTLQKIVLPQRPGWNLLEEGDTISFSLRTEDPQGNEVAVRYYMEEGEKSGISFDSTGRFTWVPPFDYVERLQQTRDKHIFFIAEDAKGNIVSEKVVFTVFHKNQPPTIRSIPPFYVLMGTKNTVNIGEYIDDADGDPIVFITKSSDLPEGLTFNSGGRITWDPSRNQYNRLRREELKIPFYVEDQPAKTRTLGFLQIESSTQDLPPEIIMAPGEEYVTLQENERLHLVFHLSDPNGDDDVDRFSFVAEDPRLRPDLLLKNTDNNYEFIWSPGFDFVKDPDKYLEFEIRFFALDRSRKMGERKVTVKVEDTEDLSKKDAQNYETYKELLIETLNLMDHLEENQKSLEKELKKAKKGKKNRALVNATIGAITGLSPVIAQDNTQKTISVIGGTSTLTLGSLEAKEVIGKSVSSLNEKIKVNAELYNQYLSEGISFARRYNTKAERRSSNYMYDVEKLRKLLNNPKLAVLELDAAWSNSKRVNEKRLKSTFTEFGLSEQD